MQLNTLGYILYIHRYYNTHFHHIHILWSLNLSCISTCILALLLNICLYFDSFSMFILAVDGLQLPQHFPSLSCEWFDIFLLGWKDVPDNVQIAGFCADFVLELHLAAVFGLKMDLLRHQNWLTTAVAWYDHMHKEKIHMEKEHFAKILHPSQLDYFLVSMGRPVSHIVFSPVISQID